MYRCQINRVVYVCADTPEEAERIAFSEPLNRAECQIFTLDIGTQNILEAAFQDGWIDVQPYNSTPTSDFRKYLTVFQHAAAAELAKLSFIDAAFMDGDILTVYAKEHSDFDFELLTVIEERLEKYLPGFEIKAVAHQGRDIDKLSSGQLTYKNIKPPI